ncbi:MAG: HNH endonuclease [Chthoniobacterales bacterium]
MDLHLENCIPRGFVVDHLNGDGLDNRRSNLEAVRSDENTRRYHVRKHRLLLSQGSEKKSKRFRVSP